jgi:hypothetical protein
MAVTSGGLGLDPTTYQRHPLHGPNQTWSETNCYTDLWIELLHALGAEPLAVGAFCLSVDFEGTQWSFFKPPLEDLYAAYRIRVGEMNAWRPVLDHVCEELGLGRLVTVEVDSWFLPDTTGTSYLSEHVKTSIVPQSLDREAARLQYFHGPGYYELAGDDFDGLFAPMPLPPYMELIRLEEFFDWKSSGRIAADSLPTARELTAKHLTLRPASNPIRRMGDRIAADVEWLRHEDLDAFHRYAFGTARQCGSSAGMASAYAAWLDAHDGGGLAPVATAFAQVAEGAKALQFALARAARGRAPDIGSVLAPMADAWDEAMAALVARYG